MSYNFYRRDIRRRKPEDLIKWALSQPVKSPAAKLVLIEMARQCDSPFLQITFCNKAAAKALNLAVKTVRRAIAELEALDLISSRGTTPMDGHRYLKNWKLEAGD